MFPYDVNVKENTARTLEYAYLDFTIYQLAKALQRPKEEIELFAKRSQNYKNHFDPSTGLMRGKNKNGQFQSQIHLNGATLLQKAIVGIIPGL